MNNAASGGLVLERGGKLFLSDLSRYSGTYMLDQATGETALLDGVFWFMNDAEDGIYYSDQLRGHRLCRFDTVRGVPETVSEHPCCGLVRQEDALYYIHENDRKLYRFMLRGRDTTCIADEPVDAFALRGDKVYYATAQGIRSCSASDGGREIVSDASAAGLLLVGEKLFFADKKNGYRLSALDLATGSMEAFGELVPGSLASDGRYIYCSNRRHADSIYRVDVSTGSSIRICGESADYLHVVGEHLYFCSGCEWYKMSLSGGQPVKVIT